MAGNSCKPILWASKISIHSDLLIVGESATAGSAGRLIYGAVQDTRLIHFKRLGGYGELGDEINAPIIERNGSLYFVAEHNKRWSLNDWQEAFYGLNRDGKFTRFSTFCGAAFADSLDAMALYIVKPDPAKGTDEWVSGAKEVMINGLRWRHKEIPIQD